MCELMAISANIKLNPMFSFKEVNREVIYIEMGEGLGIIGRNMV